MRRHRLLAPLFPLLVAGACAAIGSSLTACSASPDLSNGFGGSGAGSPTSAGQNSGGSGTSTSSLGQGGGTTTLAGGNGGSTSSGFGGGCASSSQKADKLPLDMFIMEDQSGSMTDPVNGGGDKWGAVTNAFKSFVQSPQTAGLGVGIQYFGLPPGGGNCPATCMSDADCGACGPCLGAFPPVPGFCLGSNGGDSCDANDYAKPDVEIAPLPGVAPAIINSLNAHSPTTSTPISAALQGAIQHAKDWQTAHPDHVVIAVFSTDGDPTECDTDQNHINNIAAAGSNGVPKILTFVIGVGTSLQALNGVAAAGGTGQAFLVDTNANANQQFLDALVAIQGQALGCEYTIPKPAMGTINFDEVNVSYTPDPMNAPNQKQIFPKVNGPGDCPMNGDAWYYDNNAAPTKIVLCKNTCDKIKGNTKGQIDVVLGCATIVP